MHTVTFITVAIFMLIAAVFSIFALVKLSRNDAGAKSTLTAGFVFALFGVMFGSLFFLVGGN
ncbi:MAG: hypothetical protein PHV74_02245 [Dehalococcoidia bacterium]|nr:hypothetical protein [Dehalococcoidia bacterium]